MISLHLTIGDLTARVQVLVVDNLSAECILERSFISQFVKAILSKRKKVLFYETPAVVIIKSGRKERSPEGNTLTPSSTVRVAESGKSTLSPKRLRCFKKKAKGLTFIQNCSRMIAAKHLLMANGLCMVVLAKAFPVWITKFSSITLKLYNGQIFGYAKPAPEAIFALVEGKEPKNSTHESQTGKKADWSKSVHVGAKNREERQEMVDFLSEFSAMC